MYISIYNYQIETLQISSSLLKIQLTIYIYTQLILSRALLYVFLHKNGEIWNRTFFEKYTGPITTSIQKTKIKTEGFLGKLSSDNNNNQTFDIFFIHKILYIFCYFWIIYNLYLMIATVLYRLIPIFRRLQFI